MEEKINSGIQYPGERAKESVFLVEVDRIKPNPYQPRRQFDEAALRELADSIREYGVLQPVVVVRRERDLPSGTTVEYELLAGERRLRACRMVGVDHIPVIIKDEPTAKQKLELALVENLQREDLNPIERARAFRQLMDDFHMKQREVAQKVGKSRESVANTMRLLALPEYMQNAVVEGKISEGHTRPLLMLADQPDQQESLFIEIIERQLSVRDAERMSRSIAQERQRKRLDPETREIQDHLEHLFGTRVSIERKGEKGKISIEFYSDEELQGIFAKIQHPDNQKDFLKEDSASSSVPSLPADEPLPPPSFI